MFTFELPIKPLSVNQAWQGRRFKTKKYTQFEKDVNFLLLNNKIKVRGLVKINYFLYLKNWSRTDGDNCIKCLQDIIVKNGIIEDDRKIMEYHIYKIPAKTNSIRIEINKM